MQGYKYSKNITNRELFWLTKRSTNVNISYDIWKKGRCYVYINLNLLELEKKYTNELTLFDMQLEAQLFDHYHLGSRHMQFKIIPIYSNYFLNIKSFNFDYYDSHE